MVEKRSKRKNCRLLMKVTNAETGGVMGFMFNLSTEGLMIAGEQPFEPDTELDIKLELPTQISGIKEIVLPAVSRWCEPDEDTPNIHNAGFKLLDVPKQETKILKKLMKKYCF